MAPTTIQLEDSTKARLARLKIGAWTYDDVIVELLDGIDEDAFRKAVLDWEADFAKRVRSNPKNKRVL